MSDPRDGSNVDDVYAQVRKALLSDGQTSGSAHGFAELIVVAPRIRVVAIRSPTLPPATHTNCYILGPSEGRGEIALVDPGTPYPDQLAGLDELIASEAEAGRRLTTVALTHHHWDHVSGAAHVRQRWGARVIAHRVTAELVGPRLAVDGALDEGPAQFGGLDVDVLHTPGHARGHLCFAAPASGATIVGDMVAGVGTILIDPDEGDMAAYLASLSRLEGITPGTLLPAHGPMIPDGVTKLAAYRAHRLMRENKLVAAVQALPGHAAAALVPTVYADTAAAFWPIAERSLLAHLRKLEADGKVRRASPTANAAGGDALTAAAWFATS